MANPLHGNEIDLGALDRVDNRLVAALESLRSHPDRVGPRDLAGLIRQRLRRASLQSGADVFGQVPLGPGWPTLAEWMACNIEAVRVAPDRVRLRAEPWTPSWMGGDAPAASAFAEVPRRIAAPVAADPFARRILGSDTYLTTGQREAVRTVAFSPPGATVVVCLPTGSGKTEAALVPALLGRGVSVFVTPTTALALDQERRLLDMMDRVDSDARVDRYAYYSGLTDAERDAIRQRIGNGSQRIVFTSPESLMQSLTPSLFLAAEQGFMRYFIVDEAHIVTQWGDGFRPDLQAMAGLRVALLRTSGDRAEQFRTVLMTATLTRETLDTLAGLFGQPGPLQFAAASALRPEPSYWMAACADESERTERLLEAIDNVPRPLIVYTTRVDHAEQVTDLVRGRGYRRLARFTGRTLSAEREAVIAAWQGAPNGSGGNPAGVDIIIATSAFGLGVDLGEVRTVIHATIPESIDRFYQEVGRGGRDGKASLSLTLHTPCDRQVAEGLGNPTVISTERARERWSAMRKWGPDPDLGDHRYRLDLSASPPNLGGDSDLNQRWNTTVLAMMARSHLLQLDAEPPPRRPDGLSDEAWELERTHQLQRYRTERVVRLIASDLEDPAPWHDHFEATRRRIVSAAERGLELMFDGLAGTRDIADLLCDAYSVIWNSGADALSMTPFAACGGCAHCRQAGVPPYSGLDPIPPPNRRPYAPVAGRLAEQPEETLWVEYVPSAKWTDDVRHLLVAIVSRGVRAVYAPTEYHGDLGLDTVHLHAGPQYAVIVGDLDDLTGDESPFPDVVVVAPSAQDHVMPGRYYRPDGPIRMVVFPSGMRDWERPDELLRTMRSPSMSAHAFVEGL